MLQDKRSVIWLTLVFAAMLVVGLYHCCFAANLIVNNPSFETVLNALNLSGGTKTGTTVGWNYEISGAKGAYLLSESKGGNPKYYYIGNAYRIGPKSQPGYPETVKVYQDILVMPQASYTASVYVRTDSRFGLAGLDSAGLWIQELAEDDSVVVDHGLAGVTTSTAAYVKKEVSFTTNSQTAKVRFMLYTNTEFYFTDGDGCIKFDEAVLDGPPLTRAVTGRVTSGGVGVSGATVSAPDAVDATTDNDGYYTLNAPVTATAISIRAAKDGYYAQRKYRIVPLSPAITLDYDLEAVGSNLLPNAGFDDCAVRDYTAVPDSWYLQTPGTFSKESYWESVSFPANYQSGEEAAYLYSMSPPQETSLYQIVPIQPDSSYTAKVWALAQNGSYWYTGSDQKAALFVQVMDRTGTVLHEHKEYLTDFAGWQQLVHSFSTGPTARYVKISCWANLLDNYGENLCHVVFDDVELNGTMGSALPPLYGVVKDKDTGVGLSGAFVELVGIANTTTESDGYWEFSPAPGGYTIRAGAGDGYYAQRKSRTSPNLGSVTFDLQAVGNNLLGDAGFDNYITGTWGVQWSRVWPSSDAYRDTMARVRMETSALGAVKYYESGEESIAIYPYNTSGLDGWIYQKMAVLPSTEYTAKARFHAGLTPGQSHSWGLDPSQSASLFIKEYDASGTLINTSSMPATLANPAEWETLTLTITTNPQTAYVEVGGYALIADANSATNRSRAVFDTMELNGPAAPYSLSGSVTGTAGPISGATVVATDVSSVPSTVITATTDANGLYTIPGSKLGHEYNIRVTAVGYYAMHKGTAVNGVVAVNFALQPLNLLFNAGFDDGAGTYWGTNDSGVIYVRSEITGRFNTPGWYDSGENAMSVYVTTGNQSGWFWQGMPVQPGQAYTASAKFHAAWLATASTNWGINTSQVARLFVHEFDAAGTQIGGEQYAQATLTDLNNWETLTLNFTTSANTASINIGGYAYLVDGYNANLGRAVFDTFSLTGPAAGATLGDLKSQPDNTQVYVYSKVVTAKYDGFFYIEETDRSSGIRVEGSADVGTLVDVTGTLTTVNGEKAITGTVLNLRSSGAVPDPLGMTNRSTVTGLSAVGLYVALWGTVDSIGDGFFTMTDGSGASFKVYGAATQDDYVKAVGALGAELDELGSPVPVLRSVTVEKMDQ